MSTSPFDRSVARSYEDWYATPFGRLADELERSLVRELLGPVRPGPPVVEIGCGTAHFTRWLDGEPGAPRTFGVDHSLAMLEIAASRVPVARGDAQRLPVGDDAAGAALVIALLDFVEDPAQVLREALRIAPRVALIALATPSALALRRRLSGWRGHPVFSRARLHSAAALRAFARGAGAAITLERRILVLPPSLAGRIPAVERRLSRMDLPVGGLLGLRLERG